MTAYHGGPIPHGKAPELPPIHWVRADEPVGRLYVKRADKDDLVVARVCMNDRYEFTLHDVPGRPDAMRVDMDPAREVFAVIEWDLDGFTRVLRYNKLGFKTRKAGGEHWTRSEEEV
ncbi:MAG: hypothetical protein PUF11_09295 [Parafannyhessea umbonata]|uniref:hypothetical protein n=1 Tax=Parafannyhessea umbonata TaxID=604330 RepID=UPI0026EC87C3|nr:hypothetical protein [Parafannyhessea umbonata]MDD6566959.1 hypothetical protein [Parafannyhessea umbonata]